MRSGFTIAIAIAVVVFVAGIFWFNSNSEQVELEEQRAEQAEQLQREDEERARLEAEQAEAAAQSAAVEEDAPGLVDDGPIVVGDRVTDDTLVVESETDEPIILDADDVATSTLMVDDATSAGSADGPVMVESPAETGNGTIADAADPEQLLTPGGFNRDEILALITESEDLTDTQRSSLSALVKGADANPAMIDPTIRSIRAALDLPSLN